MGTSDPGGQTAAKLPADIGHRRPGKGAGLLEGEVVELQPGDLAVPPTADDRLGDLLGVDADPGPGVELVGADHLDHPQGYIGRVVKNGQCQLLQQIWGRCQSSGR